MIGGCSFAMREMCRVAVRQQNKVSRINMVECLGTEILYKANYLIYNTGGSCLIGKSWRSVLVSDSQRVPPVLWAILN